MGRYVAGRLILPTRNVEGAQHPDRNAPFEHINAQAIRCMERRSVDVHDFPSHVVTDHDTPVFAVTSIRTWWQRMGLRRYPDATELFLNADGGGNNSRRWPVSRVPSRTPDVR